MTRLIVAAEAAADVDDILDYLTLNAGPRTGRRLRRALRRGPGAAPRPPRLGTTTA